MNNKHIKMTVITSIGLGAALFLLFWLMEGLYLGIAVGAITLVVSFGFLHYFFSKSESTLNNLVEQYSHEGILYSDSAGLMQDNREVIGALLITKVQLIFSPISKTQHMLQIKIDDISKFYNENGFLHIIHENDDHTFKVFDCPGIVEILNSLQI